MHWPVVQSHFEQKQKGGGAFQWLLATGLENSWEHSKLPRGLSSSDHRLESRRKSTDESSKSINKLLCQVFGRESGVAFECHQCLLYLDRPLISDIGGIGVTHGNEISVGHGLRDKAKRGTLAPIVSRIVQIRKKKLSYQRKRQLRRNFVDVP